MTGLVADPSGAAGTGAQITVVNIATGYEYKAASNEAGQYNIPTLLEGVYRLKAVAPGFQEYNVEDMRLSARGIRRIDTPLSVTQVSTSVEVSTGATLIDRETARAADVRSRQVLLEMPLSARRE